MQNPSYMACAALVEALAEAGVEHACVAPGSRSTPLALVLGAHPRIRVWSHVDERSAAFFALGAAKASGAPVVLACTSGTAAANFLPAIVEAHHARVPLIVLTADRPPELRDCGAGQTIDQIRLYGAFARWFFEAGVPDGSPPMWRHFARLGSRAVAEALGPPAGVAHVNLAFREPLAPSTSEAAALGELFARARVAGREAPNDSATVADGSTRAGAAEPHGSSAVAPGAPSLRPTRREVALGALPSAIVASIAGELAAARRALLVCGPNDRPDPALRAAARALAEALDAPLVAEPASNLRHAALRPWLVEGVEAIARDERRARELAPDLVVRLGAPPTSRILGAWLEIEGATIAIDEGYGWTDPGAGARRIVHAPLATTCVALASALDRARDAHPAARAARRAYGERFARASGAARDALARAASIEDPPFEGQAVRALAAALPAGSTLYVGNSLAIRALDFFWPAEAEVERVLSNRGANGIDGFVSSVLGAAAASAGPVVGLCGDLSFLHDANGLLAARRHGVKATFLVVQNDGGGIFDFLPVSRVGGRYEELFVTPHGLDFRGLAEAYGASFERVSEVAALGGALCRALAAPRTAVVELCVRRDDSVAAHARCWEQAHAALEALGREA
jgi:2-succinyl-5-enolpyruvyl-6-hydroxy-3-cyclohexene-1-carboxylate synthase